MIFSTVAVPLLAVVGVVCQTPIPPSQDPFYRNLTEAERKLPPGRILAVREAPYKYKLPLPIFVSAAHQILYRTTDSFGEPTAALTTVLIPPHPNNKILAYLAVYNAPCVDCSPSYTLAEDVPVHHVEKGMMMYHLAILMSSLHQGWVVTMPDFEGLNAAYMANIRGAYAVLDSTRALLEFASGYLPSLTLESPVAIMGYSGASTVAVLTVELQEAYAPELNIAGAAVGGLIPNLRKTMDHLLPSSGMFPLVIYGLANEYSTLNPMIEAHLVDDPEKAQAFRNCRQRCMGPTTDQFGTANTSEYFHISKFVKNPVLLEILDQNSIGRAVPTTPLLFYESTHDDMYPNNETDKFVADYCAAGAIVDYRNARTESHGILGQTFIPPAVAWLNDRLAGVPSPEGCTVSTHTSALTDPQLVEFLGESVIASLQRLGL